MGTFPTVVIRRSGGRYRITQGGRDLLVVPSSVMDRYEPDAVFPPQWAALEPSTPDRRLFWHPSTLEYLMAGLEAHPARLLEEYGSEPYRSYLQGFWLPRSAALVLRVYWNPADPLDAFGDEAKRESLRVQTLFSELLAGLRPPPEATTVYNATEAYVGAIGVNGPEELDLASVRELSLTPPIPLSTAEGRRALELAATGLVGMCFPVARRGRLEGVHALSLRDLQGAEAFFAEQGLLTKEGEYRPH